MGAEMGQFIRAARKKQDDYFAQQAANNKHMAEMAERNARIQRLEEHARQASAYAHQMAAAQQQRAAAEAAQRKAAEEAARKRAAEEAKRKKQAAVDKRSQQFDAQREERKQKNAANNSTNNATNYWDEAQSIVQSSFGSSFRNSFGGGEDTSQQSKYNVMGNDYDFSNDAASESAPNGNVEATGDNKPPDAQNFANNYKSKVLERRRNKQANNRNNYNA